MADLILKLSRVDPVAFVDTIPMVDAIPDGLPTHG